MESVRRFAKRFKRRHSKQPRTRPRAADTEPTQPLPFLSTTQHPPVSTVQDTLDDAYGAFLRLPPELRRLILTHAFGGRTVHVDLSWRHPLVRRAASGTVSKSCGTQTTHCGLVDDLVEDEMLPERWQWFSCVCHRSAETDNPSRIGFYKFGTRLWPFEDECLRGNYCDCSGGDGPEPGDCFLGVMGWLLACRGAYADGVDVLFSTNTFYISSIPLLLNMRRLMSPHGIDKLKSVQLALGGSRLLKDPLIHGLWGGTEDEQKACALPKVCAAVPNLFSNVRCLELYVQSWLLPSRGVPVDERVSALRRDVLDPLEDMVRSLGAGKQVVIAFPMEAWKALAQKHREREGDAFRWEPEAGDNCTILPHQRFWRALGRDDKGNEVGYWLRTGWNDHALVNDPHMVSCFGGGAVINDVWGYYRREAALGRPQYSDNITYED